MFDLHYFNMCVGLFHLRFILFGTLGFLDLGSYFFSPILRKFSTIISSSICSCPFFLSSSSGTPIIQISGHLTVSERSLRLC